MSATRYALGVDLGTTYTCAAVAADGAPRIAQLSGTSHTIPSVVSVGDSGMLAGEAAERRLVTHPAGTAREFKRRFGDPAPIVLDGKTYGADALTAALLSEVLQRVELAEGAAPSAVALAHPASWGPFRLDLLRAAAAQAGIAEVQLVPEPVAAAVANSDRVAAGSLVAVYDLGGGTFDAAVVRCVDDWPVVGTPEGVERLGGIDFDQAIMAHVDQALDGQVFTLDSTDPDARSALMRLRAECQQAKEQLSQDTDADIVVALPNLQTSVRLTRSEFEAMVRPRLADSLTVLDRVVASASVTWDDISAVLLVGGSSNIPTVGQMVSEHTGRPIISATNPHLAIALGTAAIAQRSITRPAATTPKAATADATGNTVPTSARSADGPTERKRPTALVIGAIVAVACAIGAFVVLGGGGDDGGVDGAPSTDQAAETVPAAGAGSTLAVTDEPIEPTVSEPPVTVTGGEATDSTPAGAAFPITVCTPDAGDALRIGVTDTALYVVTADDVKSVDSASLAACSIDLASAPSAGIDTPIGANDVAGFGTALALSSPTGGAVINQASGNAVPCAALTGNAAVTDDGALFVVDAGVVSRYGLDRTSGCTATETDAFDDMIAAGIAVGGRNRLAVTGTDRVTGAVRLWLVRGNGDVTAVDGFAGLDGVVRCGDLWCALDVGAGVIHLVELDGDVVGDVPLSAGPGAPVTEVLDLTSNETAGAIALVRLADRSTAILRLGS